MAPTDERSIFVKQTVFDSDIVRIANVIARPRSASLGALEQTDVNVVVLLLRGLAVTHFGPRDDVLGTSNDAVLLPKKVPHRFSFPGAIGDHCLALRWSDESLANLRPDALDSGVFSSSRFARRALLNPQALIDRARLCQQLRHGNGDALAVEELSVQLLTHTLQSADRGSAMAELERRPGDIRSRRLVDRARQALAADPTRAWSLGLLGQCVGASPYHLAHVFRRRMGLSVFNFLTRLRLVLTLDEVLESRKELSTIALDAGFAHHSHYSARFREVFRCTPRELRRTGTSMGVAHLRNIATVS